MTKADLVEKIAAKANLTKAAAERALNAFLASVEESLAKDDKLTLTGFAYEKGVNELVIQQDEDYITQIEIPVQDPCSDGSSPRSHRTT